METELVVGNARPDWMTDEHWAIEQRVARGIGWLIEHDPDGVFHFWFESGITARSPLPAQDENRKAEWERYWTQRTLWERLDAECRKLDGKEAA